MSLMLIVVVFVADVVGVVAVVLDAVIDVVVDAASAEAVAAATVQPWQQLRYCCCHCPFLAIVGSAEVFVVGAVTV